MKLDDTFFCGGGRGVGGGFKSLCSEGFELGSNSAELTTWTADLHICGWLHYHSAIA